MPIGYSGYSYVPEYFFITETIILCRCISGPCIPQYSYVLRPDFDLSHAVHDIEGYVNQFVPDWLTNSL